MHLDAPAASDSSGSIFSTLAARCRAGHPNFWAVSGRYDFADSGIIGGASSREGALLEHHGGRMRWYNPRIEDFEWRQAPESDEEALSLLEGSPHTPNCTRTYREWRELGASVVAALIRAGEAAKESAER